LYNVKFKDSSRKPREKSPANTVNIEQFSDAEKSGTSSMLGKRKFHCETFYDQISTNFKNKYLNDFSLYKENGDCNFKNAENAAIHDGQFLSKD
jgi:hypothetical protein